MQNARETLNEQTERNGSVGILREVWSVVSEKQISGFAQMVAYNVLFATAPLLMVLVAGAAGITRAVNSDMENPAQPLVQWMQDKLPSETSAFLNEPIERAVNADSGFLFSFGAIFALWGARGAVAAIIRGLNVAYGIDKDPRSFASQTLRSLGLTLLLVVLVGVGGLVFALGSALGEDLASAIGLGSVWTEVSVWLRWPLIAAIAVIAVMGVHRYGPAVQKPFRWYLPGAAFTVVGVYIMTIALGFWFGKSQSFSETYGVFGSVLAFIMWLYLMAFVVLLGGVINAVIHKDHATPSA